MQYKRNCEIREIADFPENMQRIALGLEYNGAHFKGFQKQKTAVKTVQFELEKALSSVADEPLTLICAGRTDSGVHASNQIVHFDTLAQRQGKAWVQGVNSQLPPGVRVQWSQQVSPLFHARFRAKYRCYRYLIYSGAVRPAIMQSQLSWVNWQLDADNMHQAAQYLLGEHDFSSFRAAHCQAASPLRRIENISVQSKGEILILEICANAFLYHMVRNIVGSLIEVGRGAKPVSWFNELLALRDRKQAPAMASAEGLYLVDVGYPEEYGLPLRKRGPLFLGS